MTPSRRPHIVGMARAAAVGSAAAALPMQLFSPLWLILFALPGVLFLWLGNTGSVFGRLSFVERLAAAAMLQGTLAFVIFQTDAAPVPQAALTYLLIAPLAYSTLRYQELDILHSLFLSLCVLLIGAILQSRTPLGQVIVFVCAASLVLQHESRRARTLRAVAARLAAASRTGRNLHRAAVAAACLLAFSGAYQLLRSLPNPNRTALRTAPAPPRQVGVSTQFELGRGPTGPLNLIEDELVSVRVAPDATAPDDLYLRCGHFDVAGIDRWDVAPVQPQRHDLRRRRYFQRPVPGVRAQPLDIHRLEGHSGFIYVPPGTFEIFAPNDGPRLWVEPLSASLREAAPRGPIQYRVQFQDLGEAVVGTPIDGRFSHLTALPAALRRDDLARLARELADGAHRPETIATNIAHGLGRRCGYALRDPVGDSQHALVNFLFGDNRGFCMHFASAMAVLLRHSGVPCRIAVGLYGGTTGSESNERIFGSRHAHAWVELPFEELGWVVFDPTPAAILADATARWPTPTETPDTGPELQLQQSAWDALDWDRWSSRAGKVAPWLGLLILAALMLLRPARVQRSTAPATTSDVKACRQLLLRLLQRLADAGHPRARNTSLEAYLAALQRVKGLDHDALAAAFRAYQDVRFGGRSFDENRRRALAAALGSAAS